MSAKPLAIFAIASLLPIAASGAKLTVLHSFGPGDGVHPRSGVTLDDNGNFYGTTLHGGDFSAGTVYKMTPKGKETVLYSFKGTTDGAFPYAKPARDAAGTLYGTTNGGDVSSDFGTVFKLTAKKEKALHILASSPDGCFPESDLLADAAGNFYGTASACAVGAGSVFKITPNGKFTVIYSFLGGTDGANPPAGVISDGADGLYGTTYNGGLGWGTVYKLTTGGTHTVLYSFTGGPDGRNPATGLVADGLGNLYGTTYFGGNTDAGVVFKLGSDGGETVLHSFTGGNDGANPQGALIVDAKGNLYGTASQGGEGNAGTVFEIAKNGKFKVLYAFKEVGQIDGANPGAELYLAPDGTLYGTTQNGGENASGAVFKLTTR